MDRLLLLMLTNNSHGIPDSRPLQEGDIISIDVTSYKNGFHGDSCRTFCVGNVEDAAKSLVSAAHECMLAGIKVCAPNVSYNRIGQAIEDTARVHSVSICKEFIGHGVGRLFHCPPSIHHHNAHVSGKMVPWTAFTVEPCISEGYADILIHDDGWTAATVDCSRAAQFEHTILITDSVCYVAPLLLTRMQGHEILTA